MHLIDKLRAGLMLVLLGSISAATLSAAPSPAQAAQFSGVYLMQLCDRDARGREKLPGGHIACQSYISGVLDYHAVLQSLKIAPRIDICVPGNVSLNQMQDIVLNYLKANGQHDGFIASPAVTMALYQHYPCGRSR